MNTNAIGRFIAELRKQKVSLKRNCPKDFKSATRRYPAGRRGLVLFLTGSVLLVFSLVLLSRHYCWAIGIVLIVIAFIWACLKRAKKRISLSDKGCYMVGVGFLAAALVLEALPIGAVLIFVPQPGETIRETYSYFDFTPFGYANFSPLPTGILTAVSVLLGIISGIRYNTAMKTKSAAFICSILAAALSLLPLVYGRNYMSAASYAVFAAILISVRFQAAANRYS